MKVVFGIALSLACTVAVLAGQASALPLTKSAVAVDTRGEAPPVVLAHGCHFDMGPGMAPDPVNGPHYHDRSCNVVRSGGGGGYRQPAPPPRAAPPPPSWRGAPGYGYAPPPPPPQDWRRSRRGYGDGYGGGYGYGYGYGYGPPPRGPVCQERCRYVGPIKNCRTVCR